MRRMYSKPQLLEAVESESKVNGIKVFEDIKDKDGHARFIEGQLTLEEGVTEAKLLYGRWSLSGTHLMIVLACSSETTSAYKTWVKISLPKWILDKITPISSDIVNYSSFSLYSASFGFLVNSSFYLIKRTNDLILDIPAFTVSEKGYFRIGIDLLIDNN